MKKKQPIIESESDSIEEEDIEENEEDYDSQEDNEEGDDIDELEEDEIEEGSDIDEDDQEYDDEDEEEQKKPLTAQALPRKKKVSQDFDGELEINEDDYNDDIADEDNLALDTNIVSSCH